MIHQAKLVQRNVAIIKNIGSLNTRYSIKMDTNLTLNNDNEYIMKITKSLRNFYVKYAEMKDFLVRMSLMTEFSGVKAKKFGWYFDELRVMFPNNSFNTIFKKMMVKDTKAAVAMNTFVYLISKTVDLFWEQYPVTSISKIINRH